MASIHIMRTNVEIDDKWMSETLKITGLKTKRQVVEQAFGELLRLKKQEGLRKLRGKIDWQGDLEEDMRLDK
jgi:Arc/MetJ family transcription regulator